MNDTLTSHPPGRSALLAAALLCAAAAYAGEPAQPSGVVGLSSSASTEVTKDLMTLTLTTTREGPDPNAVQSQLKQALDSALAEAKRAARPGQLEVQTGNFSLYPRYSAKGVLASWQGSAELIVEGRDMPAIGQLVGRISTMTVGRIGYGLSREVRDKSEADVAAQAIARFRAKAADSARQFGYAGYVIREVTVGAIDMPSGNPMPVLRMKAMSAPADDALPVEAGKAVLSVTVNGTIQLNR